MAALALALLLYVIQLPRARLMCGHSANRARAPCAGAGGGASDSGLPGPLEGPGRAEGIRPSV